MSIGSRIKERREQLGITQTQLAELLGVTKGAIGNYETDANSPKASILYKVFDALHCDANYLFQDEITIKQKIVPPMTDEAVDIGVAFDNAPEEIKSIIRHALAPYSQASALGNYSSEIAAELANAQKGVKLTDTN